VAARSRFVDLTSDAAPTKAAALSTNAMPMSHRFAQRLI
jgi:hypothetical protein